MALTDIPTDKIADALREGEDASAAEFLALTTTRDVKIRESVAARTDAPLSALVLLAQDTKASVRIAVAGNPVIGIMTSVVSILVSDKDADVLVALAENEAVPVVALEALSVHGKKRVRLAVQERLGVPSGV